MSKNFSAWEPVKRSCDASTSPIPFFHEREIWWTVLGVNIGFEEDGKGSDFSRPVLVLRKFGPSFFYGVPLSRTTKRGIYYHPFTHESGVPSVALLSQVRALDAHRLLSKDSMVSKADFESIRSGVVALLN